MTRLAGCSRADPEPCYRRHMDNDRSAAEWAARALLGLAGVMLGFFAFSLSWGDDALFPGWPLVIGGLAFAAGSAVWAFLPRQP